MEDKGMLHRIKEEEEKEKGMKRRQERLKDRKRMMLEAAPWRLRQIINNRNFTKEDMPNLLDELQKVIDEAREGLGD